MPRPPRIIGAILARSNSPARPDGLLTDRALTLVAGEPVLAHIIRRLNQCPQLDALVLATGEATTDHRIIQTAESLGLKWVAGHPNDLLGRLLLAAESQAGDHVVRINGNFPLIDPWALDELITNHLRRKAEYSSNSHYQGLVYGLGAEIMAVEVLRDLADSSTPGDLYSGTGLFLRRPWDFKVHLQPITNPAPDLKACVDFSGDEKTIEAILQSCPEPDHKTVAEYLRSRAGSELNRSPNGASEVGLAKVLLFPEKLSALKNNATTGLDQSYPISVEMSLTNQCNQNCQWCSDRDLRHRSPDRLDLPLLKSFFADLAQGGTKGVTIEGGGEPTISPLFEKGAEAALDQGLAIGLITNGLDLFPPGRSPSFYRNFEWIRVSLDAADRRQYLTLKGVDGFDQVLAGLEKLATATPEVTLGVGYVLTSQNDDPNHLQHLALTLRSLGVNYLQIRPVVDHPGLTSRLALDFLKKFESPDFSINLAALTDNLPQGNAGLPCLAHSLSTVVGADGAVWLCGRLNADHAAQPLGLLTQTPFFEIWSSPERRRQTAQAASAMFCQSRCPQCRMTKYNQLLADLDRFKTRNFI